MKAVIFTGFFFISVFSIKAQNVLQVSANELFFSAVKGKTVKPATLIISENKGLAIGSITIEGEEKNNFKIVSVTKPDGKSAQVILEYLPPANFGGVHRAGLHINTSSGKLLKSVSLTGLSTKGAEGQNESPLSRIVDALGYNINLGWPGLANHYRAELQGDEIPAGLFKKAGNGKIEMQPVARYCPDVEVPFGYYINTSHAPEKHQVGSLAKTGVYVQNQTLFPDLGSGSTSFDPGNSAFGFYATGPTHTGYSEDVWNMALFPDHAMHATRIYAVKDKTGKIVKNTYLVGFEEALNGDYNDYVFIIKNISPLTDDQFTSIFNGKDLSGWHTFLQNKGVNKDPDNNFRIENSMLHVIGKDLGYAITNQDYTDYHLKVDFKWGEKRWPPRENAKRDAGICYNIPVSEPDSIWPQSIECQIQEGDVGDFWLLSYSTIEVNGKVNKPANHIQVVKKKDAERPTGQWNTVEVISYKGRCVHIVNGIIVNYGDNASVKSGRILLQSEYAEIYYRDIKVRKL